MQFIMHSPSSILLCDSVTLDHYHTKFDGGLLRLHEADEAAVDWLTTYGS